MTDNTKQTTNKNKSWPIGLVIVFIIFFMYLIGLIIFAQLNRTDLVTEEYYEQEMAYQDQIERIVRSRDLSQAIELNHDVENMNIVLQFPPEISPKSVSGSILFFRPSDAKQDRINSIHLLADGSQIVSTKTLSSGLWRVKIFWQADGIEYYDEKLITIE